MVRAHVVERLVRPLPAPWRLLRDAGTDHASHREQARVIRRSIVWRDRHTTEPWLREVVRRASTLEPAEVT